MLSESVGPPAGQARPASEEDDEQDDDEDEGQKTTTNVHVRTSCTHRCPPAVGAGSQGRRRKLLFACEKCLRYASASSSPAP